MLATIQEACVLNGAQPHGYESTFGEVSSYIARLSGSPIYSESYVRDNLGRITQRTEVLQGVTTVWGYGYDLSGRLVTVTRNGAAFESYTFDSNDNRLTKTTTAGTTTYAHDDQDRLLSAVGPEGAESWIYDGNGDLLSHNGSAGQTSFDYETAGQLLSLTKPGGDVVSYELDAGNKRAVKRVNGVVQRQWVYAGGLLPVAELDASGNLVAMFNGGFMVKNGTTYRLLRDHLGSVRLVVDASTGTVVQRLSYGPWGNVLEDTNPGFQPFGYAGGLYDPYTGLVRFGARDYDPGIGRWTCKDPISFDGGNNFYAYTWNDPINRFDSTGLESETWQDAVTGELFIVVSGETMKTEAWRQDFSGNLRDYYKDLYLKHIETRILVEKSLSRYQSGSGCDKDLQLLLRMREELDERIRILGNLSRVGPEGKGEATAVVGLPISILNPSSFWSGVLNAVIPVGGHISDTIIPGGYIR